MILYRTIVMQKLSYIELTVYDDILEFNGSFLYKIETIINKVDATREVYNNSNLTK